MQRYKHNPRLAEQMLGEKAVLLHYEGRRILGLNESGSRIWELLDGTRTIAEITDLLAKETGVSPKTLGEEVATFVADLAQRELIVDAETAAPAAQPAKARLATGRNVSEEIQ